MQRVFLAALAASTLVFAGPAIAHTSPTADYQVVEWYCYAMPLVLRRQATNQQVFQFSNIGTDELEYIIFPLDFGGALSSNMVLAAKSGTIPAGKTVSLSNTALQARNVSNSREEGAEICLTPTGPSGSGYRWRFEPWGSASIREMRRVASGWVSFTLQRRYNWWAVRARSSSASKAMDADDLFAQRERARSSN